VDKIFYRRHLPHITPSGVDYFVTFHLAGSLPVPVLRELGRKYHQPLKTMDLEFRASGIRPPDDAEQRSRLRKLYFAGYDDALHAQKTLRWLNDDRVAQIVQNIILSLEKEQHYDLWCYTIMPNHIHILFQHPSASAEGDAFELRKTMQLLKGRSAVLSNRLLGRHGSFWQDESFDHVVRGNEFERIVFYILNNPVKAGLVQNWNEWRWSYIHPKIREVLSL